LRRRRSWSKPWGIFQRLAEGSSLIRHLLTGDDRDRLRGGNQRPIGFVAPVEVLAL
jgi:hypothetical protein